MIYTRFDGVDEYEKQIDFNRLSHLVKILHRIKEEYQHKQRSMKLAIVGTRNPGVTYQEWEKLLLDKINPDEIQMVISGGAKRIGTFAKLFAARHHKPYMEFAPQYDVYGRYATLKRNTQIVKEASAVIAFPSAESKGTYHSIKEAQRLGRRVIVVNL